MHRVKHSLIPVLLSIAVGAATASGLSILGRTARSASFVEVSGTADTESLDDEPIHPIPQKIELDSRKVALGRRLFQDTRLSADNSVSCLSCHDIRGNGADNRAISIGVAGAKGDVNAPTVFNSGFNFRQFWDGRAETLEEQVEGPIHHPAEMNSDWTQILDKLRGDRDYAAACSGIYPQGLDVRAIKESLAAFERSLITPDSRFDRYLRGDTNALTADEKEGYRLFKNNGCSSCHQGILAGGNMFETFGVVADYFADRGRVVKADLGRFNVTGQEADRYKFKVPSLRNVARTAPYFHDGSAATLEAAVSVMSKYQLGRQLSGRELHLIAQFLETLSGEYPGGSP